MSSPPPIMTVTGDVADLPDEAYAALARLLLAMTNDAVAGDAAI